MCIIQIAERKCNCGSYIWNPAAPSDFYSITWRDVSIELVHLFSQ